MGKRNSKNKSSTKLSSDASTEAYASIVSWGFKVGKNDREVHYWIGIAGGKDITEEVVLSVPKGLFDKIDEVRAHKKTPRVYFDIRE